MRIVRIFVRCHVDDVTSPQYCDTICTSLYDPKMMIVDRSCRIVSAVLRLVNFRFYVRNVCLLVKTLHSFRAHVYVFLRVAHLFHACLYSTHHVASICSDCSRVISTNKLNVRRRCENRSDLSLPHFAWRQFRKRNARAF